MKFLDGLRLLLIPIIAAGCAAGETTDDEKTLLRQHRLGSDTVISVGESDKRFIISSPQDALLAGMTDRDGEIVLSASVAKDGRPHFAVFDGGRKASGILGLDDRYEPSLILRGKNESSFLVAAMSDHGFPSLHLSAGETSAGPHARLGFDSSGKSPSPEIKLQAGGRKASFRMGFDEGVNPVIEMTDSKGRVRVRIGIGADDAPFFELLDEDGKPQADKTSR